MKIDIHISLYGESFSPSLLESKIGLNLVEKKEPNEPSRVDKFRSNPRQYGTAVLRLTPPTGEYGPQMETLLSTIEVHSEAVRQSGADKLVMWVVVYAEKGEQRNLEFNPTTMGKLSALGVTLAISNYDGC
jgi:hypothetical protein